MGVIFEIRVENRGRVRGAGSYTNRAEAEEQLIRLQGQVARAGGVNDRYWVEEVDTTGMFELPSKPAPRDRYTTRVTEASPPRTWKKVHVEVVDQGRTVGEFDRNYAMLDTFEPFRQGDRDYALVSPHYTATSVMDLATGEIIGGEEPNSFGFCPVGFYVPDWWDVHDGHVLPGSLGWTQDHEWPAGDFGFVWGCVWGDDSSWKVQYLDLSEVSDGVLERDDRFGYVRLATSPKLAGQDFIRVESWQGAPRVTFAIQETFYLTTGTRIPSEDL